MKSSSSINIAIAEYQDIVREALLVYLNQLDEFNVCIDARNGKELIDKIARSSPQPDICIIDIVMPEMNGYDTTISIKERYPNIHVVALTSLATEYSILKMLLKGASGYILKNETPDKFKKALIEIYANGFYYSDLVIQKIPKIYFRNVSSCIRSLFTAQEELFLSLCCSELTYEEIGRKMNLSKRTIEHYSEKICAKIGVNSRIGLAMYAMRTGLGKFGA